MSSTCNKSFCSNYMLLKPDEAGFLDMVQILISSDIIGKGKFLDCPDGIRVGPFGHRWIIFVSGMLMKLLGVVAKPLAVFGSGVEQWLNLLSANGGFFRLLLNFLTVKVIYPDETSSSFLSFVGNIDNRVELHSKMSRGDKRYRASLSVMAAKASYENKNYIKSVVKDYWEMDFLGSYDFWNDYQEKATTQAFILDDKKDRIIVTFRGTEPFDANAWSSDVDVSWYELPGLGKIHGGFMKALGMQRSQGWPENQGDKKPETAYYAIRKLLKERLQKNDKVKFIVSGHSLGGALAVLFPGILGLHGEDLLLERLEGIYTFGQPRVGDEEFGVYMEKLMEKYNIDYFRFVYSYDLVPRLPFDDWAFMFKHFGRCIYYNNFYKGKVLLEEPNKNYFSLRWIIPKFINACWELIRSFTISYTRGSYYKENGLLRMLRVIGLLAPGLPDHLLQDYVNITQLGSSDIFFSK
ncbi:hypothetical protein BUALT_Bualt16G0035000 [Buddleja alternifolia]|uniref:Fungal lipase-type domain-containing protein n=1 Tax=Buddleja alternifolia TaxID=168488 RepID=A0AAV6W6F1_9LAMI|nr:hypothetical protein BUALT_Bualt16G0035000 [Buddleja alternifolia]